MDRGGITVKRIQRALAHRYMQRERDRQTDGQRQRDSDGSVEDKKFFLKSK